MFTDELIALPQRIDLIKQAGLNDEQAARFYYQYIPESRLDPVDSIRLLSLAIKNLSIGPDNWEAAVQFLLLLAQKVETVPAERLLTRFDAFVRSSFVDPSELETKLAAKFGINLGHSQVYPEPVQAFIQASGWSPLQAEKFLSLFRKVKIDPPGLELVSIFDITNKMGFKPRSEL